jgi:peptide/nickel transport system permease protein
MLPNILPPMMVQVSLNMGLAILNAAGLSFIGLGVRPPQPEWGIMVAEGASTSCRANGGLRSSPARS